MGAAIKESPTSGAMEAQQVYNMNKKTMPFLISIPHGGTKMPPELKDRVVITAHDLFDDSDSFTQEIYDIGDAVVKVLKFNTARAFVDAGRALNQMPPHFPDGLVKSSTCLLKPIYAAGKHPDSSLRKVLVEKYYQPYHEELKIWAHYEHIKLGLDCHSMLPVAPDISPDPGQKRPLINLGNLEGRASPEILVKILRKRFQRVFNLSSNDVTINQPFKGGYITQTYAHKPIPWIQIEMNRSLYLDEKYFDRKTLKIDPIRLGELNTLFLRVLKEFYADAADYFA